MIARLAAAAALIGSAVGATAVLAAGDEPPRPRPPVVRAVPAAPAVATPAPLAPHDTPMLVFETPDPGGGAAWAVRHFTTTMPKRGSTETLDCWELGRRDGDRFGWIDGHGTFKRARPGRNEAITLCTSGKLTRRLGVNRMRFTTVTYPPGRSPAPARTIVWGVVAPDVTAVTVTGGRRHVIGPERVFVDVVRGEAHGDLRGTFERRDGTSKRFSPGVLPILGNEAPVAGTQAVAARAPDPGGGEPWGVVVRRGRHGHLCFEDPGQLVGTQTGYVDRTFDLFTSFPLFRSRCGAPAPTRQQPLRINALISGVGPDGEANGRIERRVLENRIVYWGPVHPDVVSVTIKTPRDVRTLIPTKDFHMILAVYDGLFPGGKATATAHLRDGTEVTRSLHVE